MAASINAMLRIRVIETVYERDFRTLADCSTTDIAFVPPSHFQCAYFGHTEPSNPFHWVARYHIGTGSLSARLFQSIIYASEIVKSFNIQYCTIVSVLGIYLLTTLTPQHISFYCPYVGR